MARIIGTHRDDTLYDTADNDVVRGRAGNDTIYGSLGDDRIYGDAGNDRITAGGDRCEVFGGRGDDTLYFSRGYAHGGVGDDFIWTGGGGWASGGKGNDTLVGYGFLIGDEAPGVPERAAGNDTLRIIADADSARGHGGLGNDTFMVVLGNGGEIGFHVGIVDDFKPGEDKFAAWFVAPDAEEPYDLFNDLDVNKDGFLNRADTLAGGEVWVVEEANAMVLGGYDEGRIVIQGTTELSHATDWLV